MCHVFFFRFLSGAGGGRCFLLSGVQVLAQHGDHAVEDGYGDDEDADERLVCVLHDKSIFKGKE